MNDAEDRIKVALVNDYELVVAGLNRLLEPHRSAIEVVELDVRATPDSPVDVALFDTYGQPGLGIDRIQDLVATDHVAAVAVYTWNLSPSAREAALRAGARGLLAKAAPARQLARDLVRVANGEYVDNAGASGGSGHPQSTWPGARWGLSPRESEVLALLSTGMSNRDMAESLYVSENTIRTHLKGVFRKLGVHNRSQAVAKALGDPSFGIRPR
jgi:DNA-binding NarL/FixJ family response regulator